MTKLKADLTEEQKSDIKENNSQFIFSIFFLGGGEFQLKSFKLLTIPPGVSDILRMFLIETTLPSKNS